MEITSLKCNNCGANLDINPKIKFFTCTFCKSSLTIKKSGNVMFTEVLDEIKENTETLIDNSEEMLIEKKIARLDREWEFEKQKFGDNIEAASTSSSIGGVVMIIGMIIFMFVWMTGASNIGPASPMPILFGFFMIMVFLISLIVNSNKVSKYKEGEKKYLAQRNILLTDLDKNKKS